MEGLKIHINLFKISIDFFETNTKWFKIMLVLTRTLLSTNISIHIHVFGLQWGYSLVVDINYV